MPYAFICGLSLVVGGIIGGLWSAAHVAKAFGRAMTELHVPPDAIARIVDHVQKSK